MTIFSLTIAASDPSGGAGIEADLKVFAAHGVFGMSAITGITLQGPQGISKIVRTPVSDFAKILDILGRQMKPDAVKLGALISARHIMPVVEFLVFTGAHSVLDPVLKSGMGFPLLAQKDWPKMARLMTFTDLVTPNIPEAEILTGAHCRGKDDMLKLIDKLLERGARSVLLKGGHLTSAPVDVLYHQGRTTKFRKKRLPGKFHGTGCALSSAITSNLARGLKMEEAVVRAEEYMDQALCSAVEIAGVKYLTHII